MNIPFIVIISYGIYLFKMAVDATMRKLLVPPKFMPYLEKHRIYELFHDLGNELAMTQPRDPVRFLKELLDCKNEVRDKRVVIFLAPPYLDRIKLVQIISAKTGYRILSRYIMCKKPGNHLDPMALAVNTYEEIRSSNTEGWLLADYPDTLQEAKALIKHKVLPTHTFLLLHDEENDQDQEKTNLKEISVTPSILMECDSNMFKLRELFKSSLKTVKIGGRNLESIAGVCTELTKNMPRLNVPKVFRIALIGPKGSRRRTVAKLLENRYNIVHVDMYNLINAAKLLENDVGYEIRRLDKLGLPYSNKLVLDLLKSRLYCQDCYERGYVLTNYPRSREDFVLLDSIDTPPNKVIFLDIESSDCKDRLGDRVINMHTGTLHSKKEIQKNDLLVAETLPHPDDDMCVVEEELKFYNKHIGDLMDYCGKTGHVIDGSGPITALVEKVECVLMNCTPTASARSGQLTKRQLSITSCDPNIHGGYTYPISRTQVVPQINSEELLNRFKELKKNPHKFL